MLREAPDGWRWRMAARELIEDQNVLSLVTVRGLFNLFCRENHKLLNQDTVEPWILHRAAKFRLFGLTATGYRALPDKAKARKHSEAVRRAL